jgi:hypothetical protein
VIVIAQQQRWLEPSWENPLALIQLLESKMVKAVTKNMCNQT